MNVFLKTLITKLAVKEKIFFSLHEKAEYCPPQVNFRNKSTRLPAKQELNESRTHTTYMPTFK